MHAQRACARTPLGPIEEHETGTELNFTKTKQFNKIKDIKGLGEERHLCLSNDPSGIKCTFLLYIVPLKYIIIIIIIFARVPACKSATTQVGRFTTFMSPITFVFLP